MSVELLYPDNRNRGARVNQLVTQITTIQNDARLNKETVTDQMRTINDKIGDVLKEHGLQSIDELRKKLRESLSEDVKKKYEDLIQRYEKDNSIDSNVIDVIGLIIMVSGTAAGGAKFLEFIGSGDVVMCLSYILRALVAALTDASEALKLIEMGKAILKSLASNVELGEVALKSLKFVKIAGTVITVLGVAIDAVVLVIAAIQGAKQREDLENAINDLAYRRVTAQAISLVGDVYAQYIASMYTMVVKAKHKRDVADTIDEACDDLKKGLKNVTFDAVYDALEKLDKARSDSWTTKDPSKEAIKAWWDDGHDPTKYDGPPPKKA